MWWEITKDIQEEHFRWDEDNTNERKRWGRWKDIEKEFKYNLIKLNSEDINDYI